MAELDPAKRWIGTRLKPNPGTSAAAKLGEAAREVTHARQDEALNVWVSFDGKTYWTLRGGDFTMLTGLPQELVGGAGTPEDPYVVRDQEAEPVRSRVLAEADRVINGDRKATYGDATASFTRIADLWSPILGVQVTAQQAALCLVQLKVSRAVGAPDHADSYVDMAGYTALAAELGGVQ